MRYKPFFNVIPQEPKVTNIAPGQIQLIIHRISRLNEELASNREVYVLAGTGELFMYRLTLSSEQLVRFL